MFPALTCSAATGARAWSGFVDSLFNNSIQNFLDDKVGQVEVGPPFARSLDWMAFIFFLLVTVVVSCNVRCSSFVNTVLAVLTTGVLVFVTVAGPIMGDVGRLTDPEMGGFLPYGFSGVITGASAAFFAFNGYDSICIAAEEAENPGRSVPRAILIELLIVTVVYCGAAVGTVSLIPYTDIDLRAPIPSAFAYQGVTWAKYVVTIGPIIAITNLSLLGLYSGSRIAYRMAQDGLLMKKFAYISSRTQVPLLGVIVFGILIAVFALVLELKDLVRFSVLCMLFQYMVLAPALVALRAADGEGEALQKDEGNRDPTSAGNTGGVGEYGDSEIPHRVLAGRESAGSRELVPVRRGDDDGLVSNGGRHRTSLKNGVTSRAQASHLLHDPLASTCSYVREGDLGFGSNPEDYGAAGEFPTSYIAATNESNLNCSPRFADNSQAPSSGVSQSEDLSVLRRNGVERRRSSDLADESRLSEESFQTPEEARRRLGNNSRRGRKVEDRGCFEKTVREFFTILTTTRCLIVLVLLLAALSLQLGLGWADIRRARAGPIVTTVLLLALIVFLCEVIRKRCGPGNHDGFKVSFFRVSGESMLC